MIRKITLATLLLACTFAQARTRSVSTGPGGASDAALFPIAVPGTTVSGNVTAVNGTIISLAGGLVTIDAASAKITDDHGSAGTIASITPGVMVFAVLDASTVAANAALPASMIAVARVPQVMLSGPVQAIGSNTLTVLGRTIAVDANTSFGGLSSPTPLGGVRVKTFADIAVNDMVQVQANAAGNILLATSVLVFPPVPKSPTVIHGTVKSIGPDAWVITDHAGKDWTVAINAQTKIIGDPRVGDTVDILANTDNANQYTAVSIMKSPTVTPIVFFSGEVKSMSSSSWVIHDSHANKDVTVGVNAQTKISGNPQVNDGVQVTATVDATGNFTALTIIKLGFVPPFTIRGIVKAISPREFPPCAAPPFPCPINKWTIGPAVGLGPDVLVQVTTETKISGDPQIGDSVEVTASIDAAGSFTAISIVKLGIGPTTVTIRGIVNAMSPPPMLPCPASPLPCNLSTWTIGPAVGMGPDVLVQLTTQTKISGNPQLHDLVEVIAQHASAGYVAISIVKQ